ncbi:hypothetical protein GCK72_001065 [Caenorhabditis remanei]|uniref:Transducer of regulated CREB activity N-terminal domain-containing protein n=4 Tax=Caenorhabditis remanei TaxID=31234 RepID=A0A6A5HM19_CAERE|nr:hypothetical protein GCK72_001065 [Caenorhabditis remanei]KAF1769250.1 hypothetical protein GCK72_001065 [Caenorhabditis remanei]
MRMSNSNTPRKFSEKIAILERKQNEENTTFEDIMRQVQSITHHPTDSSGSSTTTAPISIPQQGGLLPPQQPWGHNLGGSLPNVHQMPSYSPPQWPPNWQHEAMHRPMQGHRSRSPEDHMIGSASGSPSHHYHPYGMRSNGHHSRSPDRTPPHHPHYAPYGPPYNQPGQLVPPESWNQINRARSDPAIHNMGGMVPMHHPHQQMPIHQMPHYLQNAMPGPSGMMHQSQSNQHSPQMTPQGSQQGSPVQMHHQIPPPLQMGGTQQIGGNGMSPLQSPNHMMTPMYGYHNGSPLHSPMDSPHASTLMLDGSGTPHMELSPPGMHDFDAGSLPNLQNIQNSQMQQQQQNSEYTNGCNGVNHSSGGSSGYYHTPIGPRHSTGACGPRLVPGPALTPESQSAPTSPHNQLDPNQPPMWPTRTFSNSPEALDIPKLTITNAEGAPGHHVDSYNDFNDLGLESLENVLCNGGGPIPNNSFHDPGGTQMLQN